MVQPDDPDDQAFSLTSYFAASGEGLSMTPDEREQQGSLTGSWIDTVVPAGNPALEMSHQGRCNCRRCRMGFPIHLPRDEEINISSDLT